MTQKSPDDGFNYIMLSDVHLGSDIIPHLRPWASTSWLLEENEIDARLVSWLDHYAKHLDRDRPWRLVIAGDFLDLAGVSITTPTGVLTPPTAEEQRHGLGSAIDHVLHKVEAIAQRHPSVFRALGRFVGAGNALVMVRGNHDIELYWREAQSVLIDAILAHEPGESRLALRARIAIRPWFFAVDGLLYVEHGHEFDPLCGYGDPLASTCAPPTPCRMRSSPPFAVCTHFMAVHFAPGWRAPLSTNAMMNTAAPPATRPSRSRPLWKAKRSRRVFGCATQVPRSKTASMTPN